MKGLNKFREGIQFAIAARRSGLSLPQAIEAFIDDNRGQVGVGIVSVIIGFIIVFYVVAYTYDPLEDAAVALKNSLGNATISNVQNLQSLPDVAVLLFILITVLGLVLVATRGGR